MASVFNNRSPVKEGHIEANESFFFSVTLTWVKIGDIQTKKIFSL